MNFVYLTTNLVNGKQYVGSHNGDENDAYLGSGKLFLKAIKKYGQKNFCRQILEECNPKDNLLLESKYIEKYNTLQPNGYNISPTGGHGLNGKMSTETKKKIKHKQKGKKKIEYFIEKYGIEIGNKKYNEWLGKINTRKGKISLMKGKKLSKETKEKISKSKKGISNYKLKGIPKSEEHKYKLSESHKGVKQSKETIEKRRQKHLGRKNTEETKEKMSKSHKGKPKTYNVWNKGKTELNITPEIINKVKKLKSEGLFQKEIAEKFNFSISAVARILNGFYDNKEQISRGK